MRLFHQAIGDAGSPPLVVLHGLFGSSRNWVSTAHDLCASHEVHLLDLRNHGASPHDPSSRVRDMANDVEEMLESLDLGAVHLVGHSLGGKVAMRLACDLPARVGRLTVVDIAPRAYSPTSVELDALLHLDLAGVASRNDADERLRDAIPDKPTRLFLLTNLVRTDGGALRWRINLPSLRADLEDMRRSPLDVDESFVRPTRFVLGAESDFVRDEDHALIRAHFPDVDIVTLIGCGHNPHVDDRVALVEAISRGR